MLHEALFLQGRGSLELIIQVAEVLGIALVDPMDP